ncbi:MAG: PLP-dependent decarboxylase [Halobacteriovoraceae bacterium]|jgi:diaminopimelate decarboxylase|nr:PLP-dependent decarboxylase [Halobacteriovoraceae bacterium]MBT5094522.1 PLP-dependent decarboxylase [Halobacteriovoraceae bacterium]
MKIKTAHRPLIEKTIKRLDSSFFYYDLDGLKEHLEKLSSIMDSDLKLWYACKANPLSAILKIFRNLGFGVDVASQGELDQALSSGINPGEILTTGPSKSRKYLRSLLENEVDVIVLESHNQAYWLSEIAGELGRRPKVLLRVQLDWEDGVSVLGGNSITPFGTDAENWLKLDQQKIENIEIMGLHVFQWGNILEVSELKRIWWKITEECQILAKKLAIELKILDLGGGLGIPYSSDQKEIDFNEINSNLKELKKEFKLEKIWMELGRYAVGPFGHYMTQVIDRKTVRGKELLILDGGINHLARPALTGQAFPCQMLRQSDSELRPFTVSGPLCTALDVLGEFELPSDINEGDWLCFHQCGAYGFTEAMPFFLCHNLPAEVIIYNGDLMTPRTIKASSDWLV